MPRVNSRQVAFISAFMLVAALISFVIAGAHSRMIADDYCTAATGLEEGIWGGMLSWYENWSGLYSNFLVKSAIAPIQPEIHPYLTGLLIVGWTCALLFALLQVALLLRLPQTLRLIGLTTLLLVFATVSGAPGRQTVFWMAAIVPYGLPIISVTLYAGLLIWLLRQPRPAGMTVLVGALVAVMVFFTGGFSETYATFQVTLLSFALLGVWWFFPAQRQRLLPVLLVAWVAALAALLVVVAAPGNAIRQARVLEVNEMARNPSLPELAVFVALFTTLLFMADTFGLAHMLFVFLASAAGVIAFIDPETARRLPPQRHLLRWLAGAFVVDYILVASILTPSIYSALAMPSRIIFLPRFVQLCFFVMAGYLAGLWLVRHPRSRDLRRRLSFRLAGALVVALLIFMPVAAIVNNARLLPDFATYSAAWDARHVLIRAAAARGERTIITEELPYYMEDYFLLERYDEPPGFNTCGTRFYRVQRIEVMALP